MGQPQYWFQNFCLVTFVLDTDAPSSLQNGVLIHCLFLMWLRLHSYMLTTDVNAILHFLMYGISYQSCSIDIFFFHSWQGICVGCIAFVFMGFILLTKLQWVEVDNNIVWGICIIFVPRKACSEVRYIIVNISVMWLFAWKWLFVHYQQNELLRNTILCIVLVLHICLVLAYWLRISTMYQTFSWIRVMSILTEYLVLIKQLWQCIFLSR